MFLASNKGIGTYREAFHSGLRSGQIYGYVSNIRKSGKFSFYITNRRQFLRNTREMKGGWMPISVYVYGRVDVSSTGVTIQARFLYGLSVWELLKLYVGTFMLTLIASTRYNDISLLLVTLCALGYTLCVELISVACSSLTLLGRDDRKELVEFLSKSLEEDL